MNREELIEKLEEILEALKSKNDGGGYYDDDYWLDEERPTIIFKPPEILQFYISDKVRWFLMQGMSLQEIFKDCAIYLYGYKFYSFFETVLGKNIKTGSYPFNRIQITMEETGTIERFEIVSNTDLFCYMGGGIGITTEYPLQVSNTMAAKECNMMINNFEVNLFGDL